MMSVSDNGSLKIRIIFALSVKNSSTLSLKRMKKSNKNKIIKMHQDLLMSQMLLINFDRKD